MSQVLTPGLVGISTYVDYVYHREIQETATRESGTNGPINQLRVITATLDFRRLVTNLRDGRLEDAEEQVATAAETLAAGGADFLVVTSGTTSTLTTRAREQVSLVFLDLAEAAWQEAGGARRVGVLSTRRAAAGGIFQAAAERRGATLLLPRADVAAQLDDVIFSELIHGRVTQAAVRVLHDTVAELAGAGAETVILGNTDMTLAAGRLVDTAVPVIDSARAHARASARAALRGFGGSGARA
jgi:aspartate racemase